MKEKKNFTKRIRKQIAEKGFFRVNKLRNFFFELNNNNSMMPNNKNCKK